MTATETEVFIPEASVSLAIVAETFDDAKVHVARNLLVDDGPEHETVVAFRGVKLQTYNLTPAEFAAGLRRLADRIEEAHR